MRAAVCRAFGEPLVIEELVSGVYPLEEINEAISVVKRGEAIRNVI